MPDKLGKACRIGGRAASEMQAEACPRHKNARRQRSARARGDGFTQDAQEGSLPLALSHGITGASRRGPPAPWHHRRRRHRALSRVSQLPGRRPRGAQTCFIECKACARRPSCAITLKTGSSTVPQRAAALRKGERSAARAQATAPRRGLGEVQESCLVQPMANIHLRPRAAAHAQRKDCRRGGLCEPSALVGINVIVRSTMHDCGQTEYVESASPARSTATFTGPETAP